MAIRVWHNLNWFYFTGKCMMIPFVTFIVRFSFFDFLWVFSFTIPAFLLLLIFRFFTFIFYFLIFIIIRIFTIFFVMFSTCSWINLWFLYLFFLFFILFLNTLLSLTYSAAFSSQFTLFPTFWFWFRSLSHFIFFRTFFLTFSFFFIFVRLLFLSIFLL